MAEQVLAELDAAALAAALASTAALGGEASELRQIGFGFYSFVFRTEGGWIVRAARTAEAAARHAREAQVLHYLQEHLPVAIPESRRLLDPCPAAPFGALGYPELPGRVMSAADAAGDSGTVIAGQLGEALAALHAVPRGAVPEVVPQADPDHLAELFTTVITPLERRLSTVDFARVRDWWLALLRSNVPGCTIRTPVHGDPWYENLTVDERGLIGILDWEFLSWSDPANDLGVTLEMGEEFFREVLASYQGVSLREDATLERRARQLFATRVFYGIKFAIDRDDESEWRDSLAKLRAGPILAV